VTPWELEIGLGAREWSACYMSSPLSIFDDALYLGLDEYGNGSVDNQLPNVMRKVRHYTRRENGEDSDTQSDEDEDDDDTNNNDDDRVASISTSASASASASTSTSKASTSLTTTTATKDVNGNSNSKSQLTVFTSKAADFLINRDYQGLIREVPDGHSLDIKMGQVGIAAEYEYDVIETNGKDEHEHEHKTEGEGDVRN